MKKVSVSISYDEEKLSTLRLYLDKKGMQVESELAKALDALYTKNVPAGVREFISLRSGGEPSAPKARKQRPEPEPELKQNSKPDTEASDNEG